VPGVGAEADGWPIVWTPVQWLLAESTRPRELRPAAGVVLR
jgi:hypothetical protein